MRKFITLLSLMLATLGAATLAVPAASATAATTTIQDCNPDSFWYDPMACTGGFEAMTGSVFLQGVGVVPVFGFVDPAALYDLDCSPGSCALFGGSAMTIRPQNCVSEGIVNNGNLCRVASTNQLYWDTSPGLVGGYVAISG